MYTKNQISAKLDELPIEEIALRTNFSVHADNKITAKSLLLSFLALSRIEARFMRLKVPRRSFSLDNLPQKFFPLVEIDYCLF